MDGYADSRTTTREPVVGSATGSRPIATRAACAPSRAAYEAASRSALIDWAAGDAGDPADAVDAALRWLRVTTP